MTKINVHQVQSGDAARIHPAIDDVAESGLATVLRRLITARGVELVIRWNLTGIESVSITARPRPSRSLFNGSAPARRSDPGVKNDGQDNASNRDDRAPCSAISLTSMAPPSRSSRLANRADISTDMRATVCFKILLVRRRSRSRRPLYRRKAGPNGYFGPGLELGFSRVTKADS